MNEVEEQIYEYLAEIVSDSDFNLKEKGYNEQVKYFINGLSRTCMKNIRRELKKFLEDIDRIKNGQQPKDKKLWQKYHLYTEKDDLVRKNNDEWESYTEESPVSIVKHQPLYDTGGGSKALVHSGNPSEDYFVVKREDFEKTNYFLTWTDPYGQKSLLSVYDVEVLLNTPDKMFSALRMIHRWIKYQVNSLKNGVRNPHNIILIRKGNDYVFKYESKNQGITFTDDDQMKEVIGSLDEEIHNKSFVEFVKSYSK